MGKESLLELKKLNTFALKEHLKNKNWGRVEELLPAAEKFGVSNRLLQKGWFQLGKQQKNDNKLVSAIVSFTSARKHSLDDNVIFAEIIICLEGFIDLFEQKFSREDLVHLEFGLNRLYTFQRTRSKASDENLNRSKDLLSRIKKLKWDSPSKPETSASNNVQRIFSALHPDMTFEETKVEWARVITPLVREKMAEVDKKKKTSSGGGRKPPRDKDHGDESKGKTVKDDDKKEKK